LRLESTACARFTKLTGFGVTITRAKYGKVVSNRTTAAAMMLAVLTPLDCPAAAIVDTDFVRDALNRGAVLWDVRAETDYRKGHIPGAVNLGDAARVLRDPNTEDFVATERIAQILGNAGIDPTQPVIVYGTRGSATAHFGRFALRYFGGRASHVYHDGIDGWKAAGHPLSTDDQKAAPVALSLTPDASLALTTREVAARLHDPAVQFLDVRTPKEYRGEDVRALRGGRIPGAVNVPYEQNWREPDTADKLAKKLVPDNAGMSLRRREELQALYAALDPGKETVVYCQSGTRSAESANVLEDLGFTKVRVYDPSWLGYAAKLDLPAENESYLNVGAMNARLAALIRRVDELEKRLSELRTAATRQ
jgi:thiosulfate/3-mercaptopyruvate sulfurtransferase